MDLEYSLPCSRQSTFGLLNQKNPVHILIRMSLKIIFNILASSMSVVSQEASFLRVSHLSYLGQHTLTDSQYQVQFKSVQLADGQTDRQHFSPSCLYFMHLVQRTHKNEAICHYSLKDSNLRSRCLSG